MMHIDMLHPQESTQMSRIEKKCIMTLFPSFLVLRVKGIPGLKKHWCAISKVQPVVTFREN